MGERVILGVRDMKKFGGWTKQSAFYSYRPWTYIGMRYSTATILC